MTESLNRPLLVLIALIQGLLLFWLKESLIGQGWPHGVRVAEVLLWSVCITVPVLILLSLNQGNVKRVFLGALGFFAVVAIISAYMGWQLEPNDKVRAGDYLWVFALTLLVLLFKVVMYLQVWANREPLSYAQLFLYSWRNSILIALCLLFVLVFWGILFLWGALFDVVGIDFFSEVFEESWFLFPALALANGLAFTIFRRLVGILDTMSRVLRALCQFLLPVLAFISILFLVCLPFVGFSALWDTNHGTALVLWLQALTLFFFNATFQGNAQAEAKEQNQDDQSDQGSQDGQYNSSQAVEGSSPYWRPVQQLVNLGLLVLPVYSLIAIYGLWLRIDQYGLTVSRCWAIVVVGVLALFALFYTANLVINRARAAYKFGKINVRMGLVLMALMILVNTPVLDFRKLTVASQLALLESGEVSSQDFDVYYFARQLARPGYLALEELKTDADAAFLKRIKNAQRGYGFELVPTTEAEVRDEIVVYPKDLVVPDSLIADLTKQVMVRKDMGAFYILNQDLNSDGESDWVVVRESSYGYVDAQLWRLDGSLWTQQAMAISDRKIENLEQLLSENAVSVETPEWQILKIGDFSIRYIQ